MTQIKKLLKLFFNLKEIFFFCEIYLFGFTHFYYLLDFLNFLAQYELTFPKMYVKKYMKNNLTWFWPIIEHEGMKMSSSENCQYLCFQDHSCKNFTFFANEAGMRCILFRGCHSTMPCNKCLTGPSDPPINQCTK